MRIFCITLLGFSLIYEAKPSYHSIIPSGGMKVSVHALWVHAESFPADWGLPCHPQYSWSCSWIKSVLFLGWREFFPVFVFLKQCHWCPGFLPEAFYFVFTNFSIRCSFLPVHRKFFINAHEWSLLQKLFLISGSLLRLKCPPALTFLGKLTYSGKH